MRRHTVESLGYKWCIVRKCRLLASSKDYINIHQLSLVFKFGLATSTQRFEWKRKKNHLMKIVCGKRRFYSEHVQWFLSILMEKDPSMCILMDHSPLEYLYHESKVQTKYTIIYVIILTNSCYGCSYYQCISHMLSSHNSVSLEIKILTV